MRNAAILIIVLILGAYLVKANRRQHRYRVPAYTVRTIDILDGATPTRWDDKAYASEQHKRLNELGKMKYQPDGFLSLGNRTVGPNELLTAEDFAARTKGDPARLSEMRYLTVRDAGELRAFAERKMRLRTDITLASGETLNAGTLLQKPELDKLIASGIKEISVVGSGAVVAVNATVILVILIFVAMALVLQSLFWEPMMALMHGRRKEFEAGAEALKSNVVETESLEEDRTERLRSIHRACLKEVADARHRAMEESEDIIREMRRKMHTMRQDAEKELEKTMADAEEQVQKDLPQLAEAIAAAVTSKR